MRKLKFNEAEELAQGHVTLSGRKGTAKALAKAQRQRPHWMNTLIAIGHSPTAATRTHHLRAQRGTRENGGSGIRLCTIQPFEAIRDNEVKMRKY